VGLRVVEQGGARRGRRVEVEERRAGSSSDGRFAGDEDPTGVWLPASYSPPFPSRCGCWVYLYSDLIMILLIPSFCMSYAGSAPACRMGSSKKSELKSKQKLEKKLNFYTSRCELPVEFDNISLCNPNW
jgi:hypothetical protein